MFVAGEAMNQAFNEYQRVDIAPYETRGDGRLTAADFQLIENYVATLVAPQAAGGPTEPVPGELAGERFVENRGGRVLRVEVGQTVGLSRRTNSLSYHARAGGNAAVSVGLSRWAMRRLCCSRLGLIRPLSLIRLSVPVRKCLKASLFGKHGSYGKHGVGGDYQDPDPYRGAAREGPIGGLINITFDVLKNAPAGQSAISFAGSGSMAERTVVRSRPTT